MRVSNCGYNYKESSEFFTERSEGVGEYLFLIVRSPARFVMNGQTQYTKGNNVVIYQKGSAQHFGAHNEEFINDWVQFDLEKGDLVFLERLGIQFDTLMQFANVHPLSRLVKQLFEERWSNSPYADETKTLLLRLLLIKLAEQISNHAAVSSQYTMRLSILRNEIFRYPERNWNVEGICASLDISSSYLYVSYKRMFGSSIKEDVITSRIDRSKYLLANTDDNISSISHSVGYDNDVHFMYIFKKKTGLTPTQYRNSFNTNFKYVQHLCKSE